MLIHTGDDFAIAVQLTKDDAAFVIDAGATVSARLRTKTAALSSTVTLSDAATADDGTAANWATSLVVVAMSSAVTALIDTGTDAYVVATIEIEVDEAGQKKTWQAGEVSIAKGLV